MIIDGLNRRLPFVLPAPPPVEAAANHPQTFPADLPGIASALEMARAGAAETSATERIDSALALCRALIGLEEASRLATDLQRRLSALTVTEAALPSLLGEIAFGASPGLGVVEGWQPERTSALPFPLGIVEVLRPPALAEPPTSVRRLRVRLLGRLEVEVDGEPLPQWRGRRARQLLAYLALNHRDDLSRHRLIGTFWPEHSEERGNNNLSLAVLALRRLLDGDDRAGRSFIGFRAGCYFLDAPEMWLDVDVFAAQVERAIALEGSADLEGAAAALDSAIELYFGDLLPADVYEEWTLRARQRLREQFSDALRRRARIARLRGDYQLSIRLGRRLVEIDETDEDAQRNLARDYLQTGQRSRARAQMDACLRALRQDLGVEPESETLALLAAVISSEARENQSEINRR